MLRRLMYVVKGFLMLTAGVFLIQLIGGFGLFSPVVLGDSSNATFTHNGTEMPLSNPQNIQLGGSGVFTTQLDRFLIGQPIGAFGLGGISGIQPMSTVFIHQNQNSLDFPGFIGQPVASQGLNPGISGMSVGAPLYGTGGLIGLGGILPNIDSEMEMTMDFGDDPSQPQSTLSMIMGRASSIGGDSSATRDIDVSTSQSRNQ